MKLIEKKSACGRMVVIPENNEDNALFCHIVGLEAPYAEFVIKMIPVFVAHGVNIEMDFNL